MRAVTGELAGEGIYAQFFREARISAVHLEVRDSYAVPDEYEPLVRWRETGEIVKTEGGRNWCALMTETTGRGVTVARLRVVTVPHTEYTRWLLDASMDNAAAGEQIRWLPRHLADAVPLDDYWLFDNETVAFNTVDQDEEAVGLAITSDPAIATLCTETWNQLWNKGIDYKNYVESEFAVQ